MVKTEDYFGGVIDRLVAQLYNHTMDELEFVQVFEDLIDGQLRKAWMEGMSRNAVTEMTPDYESQLQMILADEHDHIFAFAEAILTQEGQDHLSGESHLAQLQSRGELWANRYSDVVNQAVLATSQASDNLVWMLGHTEQHCATCYALNNIVAPASEWAARGLHPKDPPNDLLECGGWRCDCDLVPTGLEATPGGIPSV